MLRKAYKDCFRQKIPFLRRCNMELKKIHSLVVIFFKDTFTIEFDFIAKLQRLRMLWYFFGDYIWDVFRKHV